MFNNLFTTVVAPLFVGIVLLLLQHWLNHND